MATENIINLKSFPRIKLISSLLFIIGAILASIFSIKPELMIFQIGGMPLILILGIIPLISGIVLLIYIYITYYDVTIAPKESEISIKSKKMK